MARFMTDSEAYRKLTAIVQRWRDLAERRRVHYTELYESGRWKRYYGEDQFLLRMREVVASAEGWQMIAACFAHDAPAEPAPAAEPAETTPDSSDRAAA
jgi:uncharacterized repeat protein (TIGR03809 family)